MYKSKLARHVGKWRLNLDLAGGGIWIWRELGEMEFGANWGKSKMEGRQNTYCTFALKSYLCLQLRELVDH